MSFIDAPNGETHTSLFSKRTPTNSTKNSMSSFADQRSPEIGPPLGETGSCMSYNYLGDKKMDPLVVFVRKHTQHGWKLEKIEKSLSKMLRQDYLCQTNFWDATWHPKIFTEFDVTMGSLRAKDSALLRQLDSLHRVLLLGRKEYARGTMKTSSLLEHYMCFKTSLVGGASSRHARKQMCEFGFRPYYNALKQWYGGNRLRMHLQDAWDNDNRKMIRELTHYMINTYGNACAVVLRVITGSHWIKQWDTCHFLPDSKGGLHLQCWVDCMLDLAYHCFQGDNVMRAPEHILHPPDPTNVKITQMVYVKRMDGKGMEKIKKEPEIENAEQERLDTPCTRKVADGDHWFNEKNRADRERVGSGIMLSDGRLFGSIGKERTLPTTDASLCENGSDMFLYPHGKRFVAATELVDLTNLVLRGNIWRDVRPTTKDRVSHMVHLLFTKTRHHKCLVRNIEDILRDYCSSDPLLKCLVKDILHISMLGNFKTAKVRPGFLARMYIRRDSLVFFHADDRHTMQWFKENQRLLWYALKEYYLYTVDMTPAVLQRVKTSQWHGEHAFGVRACLDKVRAAMCVDFRAQSRIAAANSSPILKTSVFKTCPKLMVQVRGIVSKTHAAQLKYMTKLRKGSFAQVLFKEMRSWDSREDKCAAFLKIYPVPPKGMSDTQREMVSTPPPRAMPRATGEAPEDPPFLGHDWPDWDRVSVERDMDEFTKETNVNPKEYTSSTDDDTDMSMTEESVDDSTTPTPKKRRIVADDDEDSLSIMDLPKPILFKVRKKYPRYVIDLVQYGEINHRRPTDDEASALQIAANFAKTREDHVFEFWWLYPLGFSRSGFSWLKHIYYLFEAKDLPDNQLKTRIENLYGNRPKDFYLLLRFLYLYLKSDEPSVVWLGTEVAGHQIEACRARYQIMPWEPTDLALVGDRYFCGCGDWGDPVVSSMSRKRTIHALGVTGGYYDTISEAVHCKRDKQACIDNPYRKISMIGVAVRVGNKRWVTLCATCGVIIIWKHDSYSEKGPDCGYHDEDAKNALMYNGTRSYIHHGFEMSTPERPYRVDKAIIALLRKKRRLHNARPETCDPLTNGERTLWKKHRILSVAYRSRLIGARVTNYATDNTGGTFSKHSCIYCMRRIPPGGGASILVVKNGLDEIEDKRRYNERCDLYGRVINRASTDVIYQHTDHALTGGGIDEYSVDDKEEHRQTERMGQTTTLELVRLCAVDWRNVRQRMFYDSTTVPFLEDLFRWIDSRRRKKTMHSAHWGRKRMNHQHYYRHENRMASMAPPSKSSML